MLHAQGVNDIGLKSPLQDIHAVVGYYPRLHKQFPFLDLAQSKGGREFGHLVGAQARHLPFQVLVKGRKVHAGE